MSAIKITIETTDGVLNIEDGVMKFVPTTGEVFADKLVNRCFDAADIEVKAVGGEPDETVITADQLRNGSMWGNNEKSTTWTAADFFDHMVTVSEELFDLVEVKGDEYSGEEDTFATIKTVAEAWGEPVRNVALKLALKHYMSLLTKGRSLTEDQVKEKINDIHIYLEIAKVNWEFEG